MVAGHAVTCRSGLHGKEVAAVVEEGACNKLLLVIVTAALACG